MKFLSHNKILSAPADTNFLIILDISRELKTTFLTINSLSVLQRLLTN